MAEVASLVSAFASLLWPVLVLTALLLFRGPLARIVRAAAHREVEIEIGGQRLTMRELNHQQNELIQDLQRQVSTLRKALDGAGTAPAAPETAPPAPACGEPVELPAPRPEGEPFAVLWVDDKPETKALLVEQLRGNGVRVDVTNSTSDAMNLLSRRRYRLIVTDMGREENGSFQPDAGLELLREARDTGVDTPVVVYCMPHNGTQYGVQAHGLGAVGVTSSAVELFDYFQRFGLL
ncbi:Response regulator receiver domain-containing protein [Streptoalloteichus tenebrarius]|uniref:Response regulator receiver domain-containing protein n=1 Tax=Streptoalloteichus tenebrarius (strain ATCC 17920 / DSM 40477 / JCM 4838 / CBS 697.72 / NBRC 16177 / NCIMB 11028 / NRRL B-12390 / A12253. 1 / ISP 5477) TaxID=1933 RepID=A0ABT1HW16_STRSD|nr:response regulator [Streptoalloteichus tenebrarius]MCP2259724.1 Response regulator receiver domain-containing protein [Streptoalloteichus tenebrarius]BFF00704.1 response regulator [Streptoalloteichus tenebrarius]